MTPLIIYSVALLIVVAVYGLAIVIAGRRKPSTEAEEMGITESDLRDYAGHVVAYDCETNENLGAGLSVGGMEWHVSEHYPERQCHLVRLPETPSGPIQFIGVFGPSVPNNFHLDDVEGLR